MRVLKFGGSTLSREDRLANVLRAIVSARRHDDVAVVVSAFGETTNLLLNDDLDRAARAEKIRIEHAAALSFLGPDAAAAWKSRIDEVVRSSTSDDAAVGEAIASALVAALLRGDGTPAIDLGFDLLRLGGDASIDLAATAKRWRALAVRAGTVAVVAGFAGRDRHEELCTLGRGGSDLVATGLAAALGARRVELWKDVDGIHDRDPHRFAETRRHDRLSLDDADALARTDAQILHPRTIEPLRGRDVELRVRGIDAPWSRGTTIAMAPRRSAPSRESRVAIFGATGGVGTSLLELLESSGAASDVGWLVDRRGAVRPTAGGGLVSAAARLREGSTAAAADREDLLRRLHHPLVPPLVVVDATASESVSRLAVAALNSGHSVVTANKIAASSSPWSVIASARAQGRYAMETTVGAALPVLALLDAIRDAEDEVHRIEAVLSGSVHAILGRLDAGAGLLEAIESARSEGLTEPDPLVDLRGGDVRRKLVILLRVAGFAIDLDDVGGEGLIPTDAEVDTLATSAPVWEARAAAARSAGRRLALVARFDRRHARIGVESIDRSHPLASGTTVDNIVRIWTRERADAPFRIAGPGAGTRWTAGGLLTGLHAQGVATARTDAEVAS